MKDQLRNTAVLSLCLLGPSLQAFASCALDLPAGGAIASGNICSASIDANACAQNHDYSALKQYLQNTLVILISGYHNEVGTQDYFGAMKNTVSSLGGKYAYIRTNSDYEIEADTPGVCAQVSQAISAGGKQNVIVVGHSKGGSTAEYMFYVCPQVTARVTGMVLVNAVLHGSFYSDWAVESSSISKTAAAAIAGINSLAPSTWFGDKPGGISLSSRLSEARLHKVINANGRHPEKVFCIGTYASPGNFGVLEQIGGSPKAPTPNDGIVALAAQSDSDLGLCSDLLTVSNANHKTFIDKDSDSNVSADCRASFAGYVLNLVRKKISP